MIIHSESSGCHEGDEKGLKGIIEHNTKNSLLPAHNRVMFELDNHRRSAKTTETNCRDRIPVARGRLSDGTV